MAIRYLLPAFVFALAILAGAMSHELIYATSRPLSGVTAIAAGGGHTCALSVDETVKCWGANNSGQLGDGTAIDRRAPVAVVGLSDVRAIATGGAHTCALTSGGAVKCWGDNSGGQLGIDGTCAQSMCSIPNDVVGLDNGVTAISAGNEYTCAVAAGGSLKCWGRNGNGQLGIGTFDHQVMTPTDVVDLEEGAASVSAGILHTCAITSLGGVKCWGSDDRGQLGDGGSFGTSRTPVAVVGLESGVAQVAVGWAHSCALKLDGEVVCWGNNSAGELGDGTFEGEDCRCQRSPVSAKGVEHSVAIVTGFAFSCVLDENHSVSCWGFNTSGELGNGMTDDLPLPNKVVGLADDVAHITGTANHVCTAGEESAVTCWGQNRFGQLGTRTTELCLNEPCSRIPVQVRMLAGDANCDQRTDALDASFILQISAHLIDRAPCSDLADFNDDAVIDSRDAALVLQYGAGLIQKP